MSGGSWNYMFSRFDNAEDLFEVLRQPATQKMVERLEVELHGANAAAGLGAAIERAEACGKELMDLVKGLEPVLKAVDLYFSQAIIWVKEHPVLTRKDFMGNHEWCFYGWKKGGAHKWYGPANAVDVWPVKKISPQKMVHLTEKPVELAVRAIQYSSQMGDNVLDLFGGSGSTLIGCEQTGRKAFLMELDPPYCDVIVTRWEKFTGRKAERIEGVQK